MFDTWKVELAVSKYLKEINIWTTLGVKNSYEVSYGSGRIRKRRGRSMPLVETEEFPFFVVLFLFSWKGWLTLCIIHLPESCLLCTGRIKTSIWNQVRVNGIMSLKRCAGNIKTSIWNQVHVNRMMCLKRSLRSPSPTINPTFPTKPYP